MVTKPRPHARYLSPDTYKIGVMMLFPFMKNGVILIGLCNLVVVVKIMLILNDSLYICPAYLLHVYFRFISFVLFFLVPLFGVFFCSVITLCYYNVYSLLLFQWWKIIGFDYFITLCISRHKKLFSFFFLFIISQCIDFSLLLIDIQS